ncbi:hypothetical protein ACFE04_022330 [Oxalis oulophora]
MSIFLSTEAQGSSTTSSSPDFQPSQNPNPNHGSTLSPHSPIQQFPISDHHSVLSNATTARTAGPSKQVTEQGTLIDKRISSNQDAKMHSPIRSGGRGFKPGADSRQKTEGGIVSPPGHSSSGSTNPAGRRAQGMNGNHLLNFHYDHPVTRPQPRRSRPAPPPRRPHKIKPYNKDLFLQANYKFVVLDTGEYAPEIMDPDKMLRWEDIICVRYSTPFQVQCPICLEYPLCPQITSCGHIFCFPCILQYLLMGEDNHKVDCYRRCPLCFVMISPKDLYTIYIENVKQYSVGDPIEFMLLTRQRDSFTLSCKSYQETDAPLGSDNDMSHICDPFSKFTFTSDVDLSVRQAISDLDSWLVKADSGEVDDLEKLPYVCAAMERLEQRKTYWNEHRASDSNRSYESSHQQPVSQKASSSDHYAHAHAHAHAFENVVVYPDVNDLNKSDKLDKSDEGDVLEKDANVDEAVEGNGLTLCSSNDESKSLQSDLNESRNVYKFYQATDGQHIILHPLNMKCLLQYYGSYNVLPHRIKGRILQLETVTQSEAIRKRYRHLSHFSLTTTFELCEVDLREMVPSDTLLPFIDEINKRERQRRQIAKKENKDKLKAEAAASLQLKAEASSLRYPVGASFGQTPIYGEQPTFSMDDFEVLGSSSVISTSPPITGDRKLFSHVTRLGYAAGCDPPALKTEGTGDSRNQFSNDSSGSGSSGTLSFANVTSRANAVVENKGNESGKKGKKQSRVLMSTAGGRRY